MAKRQEQSVWILEDNLDTKALAVEIVPGKPKLNLVYFEDAWTHDRAVKLQEYARIADSEERTEDEALSLPGTVVDLFLPLVQSWELADRKGPIPLIREEILARVPTRCLVIILWAIMVDQAPEAGSGATSAAG